MSSSPRAAKSGAHLPPRATAKDRGEPGFTDKENEDNGAERGKEGKTRRERVGEGGRKVRLEKRRRVNGGGLRAPGSRAMEPRRFIGVARDGERGRGRGS